MVRTVPSLNIYQEFLRSPSELVENLQAVIVAPHYYICRYANSEEKPLGAFGAYTGSEVVGSWPNRPAGADVDLTDVRLFLDNALLRYFHDPLTDASVIQVGDVTNKLVAADLVFRTANGYTRSDAFRGRDVQLGDVVKVTSAEGEIFWSTVAGFDYDTVAASVGVGSADTNNQGTLVEGASSTASGFTGVDIVADAAEYDGLAAGHPQETYTLTCTEAMQGGDLTTARFAVTTASGTDNVAEMAFSEGSGEAHYVGARGLLVTLTITAGDTIAVGDTLAVTVRQAFTAGALTVEDASDYTGTRDRTYVISVVGIDATTEDPIVNVTTSRGDDVDGPKVIPLGEATAVGSYGGVISFDTSPCPGDKFYFSATAAADGACNTLVLSRSLPSIISEDIVSSIGGVDFPGGTPADLDVQLFIKKNVEISRYYAYPSENFSPASLSLTVRSGLTLTDSSVADDNGNLINLPVLGGSLYVDYRAILPTYAAAMSSLDAAENVTNLLGPAIPENPLSLAVYLALLNSNGQPVNFVAVESDDTDGYAAALSLIQDHYEAYGVVPCTQAAEIQTLVKAHVLAQSAASRGRFRIAWLNSASLKTAKVTDLGDDDEMLTAQFSLDPDTAAYTLVTSEHGNFITDGVRAGDIVRYNYGVDGDGVESLDSAIVDEVLSEDQLRLVSGPSVGTSVEARIEIWRTRSGAEEATGYGGFSAGFGHRRVRHVWPPVAELADGTTAPGWSLCAALAGLRSGAAPHQPLTNAELNGFASVLRTTQDMRESDLDIMASLGTWVITQNRSGGALYTRMALTTDVSDANHWQDHRTSNNDSICFGLNNRLKEIVGTVNITDNTLAFIATEIRSAAKYYQAGTASSNLGPQLLGLTITDGPRQDATMKDSVIVVVEAQTPYGLDNLDLYYRVS